MTGIPLLREQQIGNCMWIFVIPANAKILTVF